MARCLLANPAGRCKGSHGGREAGGSAHRGGWYNESVRKKSKKICRKTERVIRRKPPNTRSAPHPIRPQIAPTNESEHALPLSPGQQRDKEARDEWRDLGSEKRALVVVPTPGGTPEVDVSDARSLINLLPQEIQDRALKLPIEFFELDPKELESVAFKAVSKTLYRKLRIAFWEEYETTQRTKADKIDMDAAFRKSCSPGFFKSKVLANDARLAWLLTPPSEYEISLKEISSLGLERMKEALEIPIDQDNPNTKLIEAQLKIFQHADMRIKGAIIQRVEQRSLNMNLNANASPEIVNRAEKVSKMSMEEIEAEISRFEGRSKAAEIPGTVHVDLMKDHRPHKVEQANASKKEGPDPSALSMEIPTEGK